MSRVLLSRSRRRDWTNFKGATSDLPSKWLRGEKIRGHDGFSQFPALVYPWKDGSSVNSTTPHHFDKTGTIYTGDTLDSVNPATPVLTWSRLMEERHEQYSKSIKSGAFRGPAKATPGEWNRYFSRRAAMVGYLCKPIVMFDGHGNSINATPIFVPHDLTVISSTADSVTVAMDRKPVVDIEDWNERGRWVGETDAEWHKFSSVLRESSGRFRQRQTCWAHGMQTHRGTMRMPVTPDCVLPVGHVMDVRHFVPGQYLTILYRKRPHGFLNNIQRYGFRHGKHPDLGGQDYNRNHNGSSRSAWGALGGPGWKFPGTKTPGVGAPRASRRRGQQVVGVDVRHRVIYLKGSLAAALGSPIVMFDCPTLPRPHWLPFPTFFPDPSEDPDKLTYAESNFWNPGILRPQRDTMYLGAPNPDFPGEIPMDVWTPWQSTLKEMVARNARAAFGPAGKLKEWAEEEYDELLRDVEPPFRCEPRNPEWGLNQHGVAYMTERERKYLQRQGQAIAEGADGGEMDAMKAPLAEERVPNFGRAAPLLKDGHMHAFYPPLPRLTDWRFPHHDPPRAKSVRMAARLLSAHSTLDATAAAILARALLRAFVPRSSVTTSSLLTRRASALLSLSQIAVPFVSATALLSSINTSIHSVDDLPALLATLHALAAHVSSLRVLLPQVFLHTHSLSRTPATGPRPRPRSRSHRDASTRAIVRAVDGDDGNGSGGSGGGEGGSLASTHSHAHTRTYHRRESGGDDTYDGTFADNLHHHGASLDDFEAAMVGLERLARQYCGWMMCGVEVREGTDLTSNLRDVSSSSRSTRRGRVSSSGGGGSKSAVTAESEVVGDARGRVGALRRLARAATTLRDEEAVGHAGGRGMRLASGSAVGGVGGVEHPGRGGVVGGVFSSTMETIERTFAADARLASSMSSSDLLDILSGPQSLEESSSEAFGPHSPAHSTSSSFSSPSSPPSSFPVEHTSRSMSSRQAHSVLLAPLHECVRGRWGDTAGSVAVGSVGKGARESGGGVWGGASKEVEGLVLCCDSVSSITTATTSFDSSSTASRFFTPSSRASNTLTTTSSVLGSASCVVPGMPLPAAFDNLLATVILVVTHRLSSLPPAAACDAFVLATHAPSTAAATAAPLLTSCERVVTAAIPQLNPWSVVRYTNAHRRVGLPFSLNFYSTLSVAPSTWLSRLSDVGLITIAHCVVYDPASEAMLRRTKSERVWGSVVRMASQLPSGASHMAVSRGGVWAGGWGGVGGVCRGTLSSTPTPTPTLTRGEGDFVGGGRSSLPPHACALLLPVDAPAYNTALLQSQPEGRRVALTEVLRDELVALLCERLRGLHVGGGPVKHHRAGSQTLASGGANDSGGRGGGGGGGGGGALSTATQSQGVTLLRMDPLVQLVSLIARMRRLIAQPFGTVRVDNTAGAPMRGAVSCARLDAGGTASGVVSAPAADGGVAVGSGAVVVRDDDVDVGSAAASELTQLLWDCTISSVLRHLLATCQGWDISLGASHEAGPSTVPSGAVGERDDGWSGSAEACGELRGCGGGLHLYGSSETFQPSKPSGRVDCPSPVNEAEVLCDVAAAVYPGFDHRCSHADAVASLPPLLEHLSVPRLLQFSSVCLLRFVPVALSQLAHNPHLTDQLLSLVAVSIARFTCESAYSSTDRLKAMGWGSARTHPHTHSGGADGGVEGVGEAVKGWSGDAQKDIVSAVASSDDDGAHAAVWGGGDGEATRSSSASCAGLSGGGGGGGGGCDDDIDGDRHDRASVADEEAFVGVVQSRCSHLYGAPAAAFVSLFCTIPTPTLFGSGALSRLLLTAALLMIGVLRHAAAESVCAAVRWGGMADGVGVPPTASPSTQLSTSAPPGRPLFVKSVALLGQVFASAERACEAAGGFAVERAGGDERALSDSEGMVVLGESSLRGRVAALATVLSLVSAVHLGYGERTFVPSPLSTSIPTTPPSTLYTTPPVASPSSVSSSAPHSLSAPPPSSSPSTSSPSASSTPSPTPPLSCSLSSLPRRTLLATLSRLVGAGVTAVAHPSIILPAPLSSLALRVVQLHADCYDANGLPTVPHAASGAASPTSAAAVAASAVLTDAPASASSPLLADSAAPAPFVGARSGTLEFAGGPTAALSQSLGTSIAQFADWVVGVFAAECRRLCGVQGLSVGSATVRLVLRRARVVRLLIVRDRSSRDATASTDASRDLPVAVAVSAAARRHCLFDVVADLIVSLIATSSPRSVLDASVCLPRHHLPKVLRGLDSCFAALLNSTRRSTDEDSVAGSTFGEGRPHVLSDDVGGLGGEFKDGMLEEVSGFAGSAGEDEHTEEGYEVADGCGGGGEGVERVGSDCVGGFLCSLPPAMESTLEVYLRLCLSVRCPPLAVLKWMQSAAAAEGGGI